MNYLIKHLLLWLFIGLFTTVQGTIVENIENTDSIAPSIPNALEQIDSTEQSVTVHWNHSQDNKALMGYMVYLNNKFQFFTTDNQCTIDGLGSGLSYEFQVAAIDSVENISERSEMLVVSTLQSTYIVSFQIKNDGIPITNAQIHFNNEYLYTNDNGWIIFDGVPFGYEQKYEVKATGFHQKNEWINVTENKEVIIELEKDAQTVTFYVMNQFENPLDSAEIYFFGKTQYSSTGGKTVFENIPADLHYFLAEYKGINEIDGTVDVKNDTTVYVVINIPHFAVKFLILDSVEDPIADAKVTFNSEILTTDENGFALFDNVPPGAMQEFLVNKEGYQSIDSEVDVYDDKQVTLMLHQNKYLVQFYVHNEYGPVVGAKVDFNNEDVYTNENGVALFDNVEGGNNKVYIISKEGYETVDGTLNIWEDKQVDIQLQNNFQVVEFRVWHNDEALEGAKVYFNGEYIYTNNDGVAMFDGVSVGAMQHYKIYKEGFYVIEDTVNVDGYEIVNVHMEEEPALYWVKFYVFNGDLPLKNASVRFNNQIIQTDETGLAKFHEVEPGENKPFAVIKEGYATLEGSITVNENLSKELFLQSNTQVVEFRVWHNNEALEGAKVYFNGEYSYTNHDGVALFDGVPIGAGQHYKLYKEGFYTIEDTVNVDGYEIVNVYLTNDKYNVGFMVFSETEEPIKNAKVYLNDRYSYTDSSGYVSFEGISSTIEHLYWIYKEGYEGTEANFYIRGDTTLYVMLQPKTYMVKFTVEHDGYPISGAEVKFNGKFSETNHKGQAYFYKVLPSESMPYSIEKIGFESIEGKTEVKEDTYIDIDLELKAISVKFVASHGDLPLGDVEIKMNGVQMLTNTNGVVVFEEMPYELQMAYRASKEGYETIESNFDLTKDTIILLPMDKNLFNLTFQVSSSDSSLIKGAKIRIKNLNEDTNEQGECVFSSLKKGTYSYHISKDGFEKMEGEIQLEKDDTIQISLTPNAFNITFVIYNELQEPVEGAQVHLIGQPTLTNEEGKVTYNNIPADLFEWWVKMEGYEKIEGEIEVSKNDTIEVQLAKNAFDITFVVYNELQELVEGAQVHLIGQPTLTNEEGKVTYNNIPADLFEWWVKMEGYEKIEGEIEVSKNDTIVVQLSKNAFDITFVVYNELQELVSGAHVHLIGEPTLTNEQGMVTYNNIPADLFEWWVKMEGYEKIEGEIEVSKNDTIEVQLAKNAFDITFVVYNELQELVEGAQVHLIGQPTLTNGEGMVTYHNIPADLFEWWVKMDGYEKVESEIEVSKSDTIVVQLTKNAFDITFVVYNELQEPVEGAQVHLIGQPTLTNEEGMVTYHNIPADLFEWWVKMEGYEKIEGEIEVSKNDTIVVQLSKNAFDITFVVYNELQEPVEGAQVHLIGQPTLTNEEGMVTYHNIPADLFEWWVKMEGYEKVESEIEVTKNDTIVIQLQINYCQLSFLILDESENPITDAMVQVNQWEKLTNNKGEVIFDSIKAKSKLEYMVLKTGFKPKSGQLMMDSTKQLVLILEPQTHWVSFTVTSMGMPVVNATISLGDQKTTTNANGFAKFEELIYGDSLNYFIIKETYDTLQGSVWVNQNKNIKAELIPIMHLVTFYVSSNDLALGEAIVMFNNEKQLTDEKGMAIFDGVRPTDSLEYHVIKDGYITSSGKTTVYGDQTLFIDLSNDGSGITFVINDGHAPVPNADVYIEQMVTKTDEYGVAKFDRLPDEPQFSYTVVHNEFHTSNGTLSLNDQYMVEEVVMEHATKTRNLQKMQASFYPIPADEYLNVSSTAGINRISIFTLQGTELKAFNLYGAYTSQIDIQEIPQGVYIIQVEDKDKSYESKRIIIQ